MLSDAQTLMQAIDYVPTSAGVEHPFTRTRIPIVDSAASTEQVGRRSKLFQEIVVKRSEQP
jgi:hypothetical protein